jgi:hypothetical protein
VGGTLDRAASAAVDDPQGQSLHDQGAECARIALGRPPNPGRPNGGSSAADDLARQPISDVRPASAHRVQDLPGVGGRRSAVAIDERALEPDADVPVQGSRSGPGGR